MKAVTVRRDRWQLVLASGFVQPKPTRWQTVLDSGFVEKSHALR